MTPETYIVECANWKAKVEYNNALKSNPVEDDVIEVCTQAFECIFSNTYNADNVMVFQLKNQSGEDYFTNLQMQQIPDPTFSLLTKAYKLKDEDNESKHFFVLTRSILENAALPNMIIELNEFEKLLKKQNRAFYKHLLEAFKESKIISNLK